jgi:hypothetical protein
MSIPRSAQTDVREAAAATGGLAPACSIASVAACRDLPLPVPTEPLIPPGQGRPTADGLSRIRRGREAVPETVADTR